MCLLLQLNSVCSLIQCNVDCSIDCLGIVFPMVGVVNVVEGPTSFRRWGDSVFSGSFPTIQTNRHLVINLQCVCVPVILYLDAFQ